MSFHSLAAPMNRLLHGLGAAYSAWASRRDLAQLDDRMLKDLGLSRAQAVFEAQRAPWNVPDRRH